MVGFETLTHCIFLNSNQRCNYFFSDLVLGYCPYLVKNSIPKRHPFFFYPHFVANGLTSREIRVYGSQMF